jgi:oxygen-dependent protoporphyrinogen oxidase
MQPTTHYPVAIVGGGIAGLSAAWALQKAGLDYVLLEQDARWGGKIRTETVAGDGDAPFIVEGGPDSFITQKPWGATLARELGLGETLIGTNERLKQTYVLNKGKATPLPDGVLMIVPTKVKPFIFSPLISPWGKLRMGMDLFIPRRKDAGDETLSEFVRRRLGSEALDKIAEPLMSGIYNAEADKQSVLATFPRFRELEEKYGSLTKGMLASQRTRQQNAASAPSNGKPISFFVTPKAGVETMVEALRTQLTGELRLGAGVATIEPITGGYRLHLTGGGELHTSQVILATPAFVSSALLRPLAPETADLLDGIRYVSTGTISLAFRSADAPNPLKGYGLEIPMSERRPINAITLNSVKFAHRAPDDHLLLRAFFGGSRSPQSMELDDATLYATVRGELDALLGIDAAPRFHRIYRWRRSNPQYDVGHLERIAAIERGLPPGIHVAGSAYRGVGIPDCVKSAQEAVGRVTGGLLQVGGSRTTTDGDANG